MSKENNVRYLTAETPPTDDNSNKVPTTEWVQEKIDDVEAAVSGGMNATVGAITVSGNKTYAPSGGGTYWCYGETNYVYRMYQQDNARTVSYNGSYASGSVIHSPSESSIKSYSARGFGIKIA